jgi:hypothetical protein
MATTLLDEYVTNGTGDDDFRQIRLGDGHRISITTPGDPDHIPEVYLFPGLKAPAGDAWDREAFAELGDTAGDQKAAEGSLFTDVPVDAVRALIEEHGGEHADQDDADLTVTAATACFDSALTDGTDGGHLNIRLADGQVISIKAEVDATRVDIYLPDAIATPDGDGWNEEDAWEALLTANGGADDGRYFYEVPVADVRKLIQDRGGEHADQANAVPISVTPRFGQAVAEGTGTGRRPMLRIRLADGEVIAVHTDAGDDEVDVYLPETITAPDSDGWELEERELQLTRLNGEPLKGRLFYEVPAAEIRALIEEHGGEHADQTNFS